jgi:O-antigen ligase
MLRLSTLGIPTGLGRSKLEDLLIQLFCLSLLLIPVGFLTIKSWVTTLSLMAFLLSLMLLFSTRDYNRSEGTSRLSNRDRLLPLLFAAPMIIDLLAQIARQDWVLNQLDAPSRLLIFIPVYILLRRVNINLSQPFITCIALASPIALTHLALDPTYYWGDRWASSPADPNTLGLFCAALGGVSLAQFATNPLSKTLTVIHTVSIVSAAAIVIASGSRIAFISFLMLFSLSLVFAQNTQSRQFVKWAIMPALLTALTLFYTNPSYQHRAVSIYQELTSWAEQGNQPTSASARIEMIEVSILLLERAPLLGYGDGNYQNVARNLPDYPRLQHAVEAIHNTPHNEVLTKALRSGIAGGLASAAVLLVPVFILLRRSSNANLRRVWPSGAEGLLAIGIVLASFSMAVFSLAFTTSFFAASMAVFLAAKSNQLQP